MRSTPVSRPRNIARPPAPVPVDATFTRTPSLAMLNSSATASLMGNTVLEPATAIWPLRSNVAGCCVGACVVGG